MASHAGVVDAARSLIDKGYVHDFRVDGDALRDVTGNTLIDPADVEIDAALRFEVEPGSADASNIYAVTDRKRGIRGLLIDAFDLLDHQGSPLHSRLAERRQAETDAEAGIATRFGLRKVSKSEFEADPARYVLRLDFPDFPECPFVESFSMLGFDTYEQAYVWLATRILRDERLIRVPYQAADVPDNA